MHSLMAVWTHSTAASEGQSPTVCAVRSCCHTRLRARGWRWKTGLRTGRYCPKALPGIFVASLFPVPSNPRNWPLMFLIEKRGVAKERKGRGKRSGRLGQSGRRRLEVGSVCLGDSSVPFWGDRGELIFPASPSPQLPRQEHPTPPLLEEQAKG